MSQLVALTFSIGGLAFVATWAFLSPWSGPVLIWAAFVAWASFFHSGGDGTALKNTIICNAFGVLCAWVALVAVLAVPLAETLTLPVWAGIAVGVTAGIAVAAAHIPALSTIPATVYGYACAAAFALQTPEKLNLDVLLSPTLDNVLVIVPVSMIIGALFGFASGRLGGMLTKAEA